MGGTADARAAATAGMGAEPATPGTVQACTGFSVWEGAGAAAERRSSLSWHQGHS